MLKIVVVLLASAAVSGEEDRIVPKKFLGPEWFKPITDSVTNLVALTKHPNFGGVQFLSPQNLWEKLHQKGGSLLTGPYASVFGAAHNGPVDYPFAFRKATE